jgi:protein-L-isoaspartate(D-aspartate) O-methyltransferase
MSSESWESLHDQMIERLLEREFIRTSRIEEAFRAVPRHLFLPEVPLEHIYGGEAIVTRRGPNRLPTSSSSEPGAMAIMLEQLQVRQGDHILEIGAGTGYNAALLAYLAGNEGEVTTIDIDEDIVNDARHNLARARFPAVRVIARDGWLGAEEYAPFERIEATVGVWDLSPWWFSQLIGSGILVVPFWFRAGVQASIAFIKRDRHLESVGVECAGFMRLRGPHSGPESYVRVDKWISARTV